MPACVNGVGSLGGSPWVVAGVGGVGSAGSAGSVVVVVVLFMVHCSIFFFVCGNQHLRRFCGWGRCRCVPTTLARTGFYIFKGHGVPIAL